MRISRKKRPDKPIIPHFNTNERIVATEVRVLDVEGNNVGVMPITQALSLAREQEMDLVEINPKGAPPVCKIVDFRHFKYQKEKEARKQKANAHESEVKGIRLSIRIGDHDMGVRLTQAEGFLNRGDKVKPVIILKGRENAKSSLAFEMFKKFHNLLLEKMPIRYEQEPTRQANQITAIIAKK
ncbi:MAG: translation initiation factor IF-3 [Candidatus Magasanikbacteria bacterium RIFCSPLOWO2_01_FULL_43_20b]|uniref:Translation initiation factor IF-3 n=1 Tax=Candidatus Magasanikbacteria bacterium RIFCSPLOWO2_12_FULL_43_12 TaxID=1798692 RepID=A0A1F6MRL1_9BACT|nr:MAG: translation initiation factor IF-3 [Candidatus Magasanikbacteria bacterium RIFCSPLOWO2_01_FULL_43_20b]OGH74063.1 MAG: translation initiation factor IF-3 [Candidatus Magasanikbacteria bacterium RIFCSPLOWO2_12_FULL_43_12]